MTDNVSLKSRLKAEGMEMVDFAPIFVKWIQHKFPNHNHVRLLKFAQPFTVSSVYATVLLGVMVSTAFIMFHIVVQGESYEMLRHGFTFTFAVSSIWVLQWGGNWAARKMAIAHGRELMVQVLPKVRYVDSEMSTRIKRVSYWFEPVGQFISDEPNLSGVLIGVLSPTEPQLFFVREIQRAG